MSEFHFVRRLPPYVFEQVNRAKAAARQAGADIVDLGMGNPDLPTPEHIIAKLCETAGKPHTNRYSASKGIAGLRRAQAAYYARRFGVKLDPETQVVATLGSKEGFANIAQLPHPRLWLPDGRWHHPQRAGDTGAGVLPRHGAGDAALHPAADRGGVVLSVQPHGGDGGPRVLCRRGGVRAQA
jgi:hypothetical protein